MAVSHYCATIADALAILSDVDGGSLSDTVPSPDGTEPTLTEAQYLQDRATIQVQFALLRESLAITVTTDSLAHELCRTAEMLWTSLLVLTGKSSLLEGQEKTARWLRSLAQQVTGYTNDAGTWVQGDFGSMRMVLTGNGATAQLTPSDSARARASHAERLDPSIDRTPGGPSVPYDHEPTFSDGDPL